MPFAPLQIPTANINSQADFTPLANLGNVYRKAQEDAAKQTALGQLGSDSAANADALLKSGVPELVQLGLNLKNRLTDQQREDQRFSVTDARANAQLAIQQAAAGRAASDWRKQGADEAEAAMLIGGFGASPRAAPAASAFPAPLPAPGAFDAPAPAAAPPITPPQAAPAVEPSAFGASPPVPAALQRPPVKAEDEDTGLPAWANVATARITDNLTSGQPAATAGISKDQLAQLYRNPITRPIATAFLQKQFAPDTWKYEKLDDGRLVATNDRGVVKDVTPPLTAGQSATKQERDVQGYFRAGKNLGMDDDQARAFAANGGKTPKDNLSPTEIKAVGDAEKQVTAGQDVLDNLARLKQLSKTAYSGLGAGARAVAATSVLPESLTPQGAIDTQELKNLALQNVAGQAKAVFGSRLAVAEVKLLNEIESTPEMSDAVRQQIYGRIERMITRHVNAAQAEAEGIRNRTYFKPGGGAANAVPAAAAASTPPTASPSLGDFMKRAREANPDASDADLARYWKGKYGG